MKTYLIQRGNFEDDPTRKGLDSIMSLQYMGAAEFEFGELPKSLKNIRDSLKDYEYLNVSINTKIITVFCKKSQKEDVRDYLETLAANKMSLHERSDFNTYINKSEHTWDQNKTDFWWDIQNHLMFWKRNDEFQSKFKSIIETKPV